MSVPASRLLSIAIATAGLGWVGYLCATTLSSIEQLLPDIWHHFVAASACLAIALFLPALIFLLLVHGSALGLAGALKLHFSGQLLKYLPGRIWGVVYQISAASGSIDGAALVRANIDLMVIGVLVNVAIAVPLLGSALPWPVAVSAAITIGSVVALLALLVGPRRCLKSRSFRLLPNQARTTLSRIAIATRPPRVLVSLVALQLAVIGAYVLAWKLLLAAYPAHTGTDAVEVSLLYLLSSVIGMLSLITPAGLGVREATFVAIGVDMATVETLAFLAVLARVWLFSIEVVLAMTIVGLVTLFEETYGRIGPSGGPVASADADARLEDHQRRR